MELDELKILLKEKLDVQHSEKTNEEISLLLGKNTQSVVGKLNRSLWIEIIACVVFTFICAAFGFFGKYVWLRIYFSIFAVVCFLFLPVLWFLLKKIKKLSNTSLPVKSNLELLVKILKLYVKRYFQLTLALIPITLLIALSLSYGDGNLLRNPLSILIESKKNIVFLTVYFIVFSFGMYYVTKWYLKKFYGNYIEQLQSLIKELEE